MWKERRLIQADAEYSLAYGDLIGDPIATFDSGENPDGLLVNSKVLVNHSEVNRFGDIYVAGIGNNRLQLYNPDGRSIR